MMNKNIHTEAMRMAAEKIGLSKEEFLNKIQERLLEDPTVPEEVKEDIRRTKEKNNG